MGAKLNSDADGSGSEFFHVGMSTGFDHVNDWSTECWSELF